MVNDGVTSYRHANHTRLAPHETLELHELLAFQSNTLIRQKKTVKKITDPGLRRLYIQSIEGLQMNIAEIVKELEHRPYVR